MLKKCLKLPIKIKKQKNIEKIEIYGKKSFYNFDYDIPGDISSAAFFIVLTLLSKKSRLVIKNVNINSSRTGCISILNKMGANIILKNQILFHTKCSKMNSLVFMIYVLEQKI